MQEQKSLSQLLKEKLISQSTYDKATIAKQYIERKYNLQTIKNKEWNDVLNQINTMEIPNSEKQLIQKEIFDQEVQKFRKQREKQSIRDYVSLAIIGRGAFGEVHVCKEKKTGNIVAVKKIRKDVLIKKNQVIHIRNEQILMSKVKNPWIVDLKASFQEMDYLFLVMEFLSGGDLMSLLIKEDIFSEEEARFYIAELILAIESIHKLKCIHRDIKPDNILISKTGHIKLSDFGLAKISDDFFKNPEKVMKFNKENEEKNDDLDNKNNEANNKDNKEYVPRHEKNYSVVGTAYYVAPEVLSKKGYTEEIDWWSVGVIFYEMLIGYAPFCSKETSEVCHKVLNWQKYLKIPKKKKVSPEAGDLIYKLINTSSIRLGKNGAEEIKKHKFFKDFDWDNVRNLTPPFIPKLDSEYDTKYFEIFEAEEPFYPTTKEENGFYAKLYKRKDIEYLGYNYNEKNNEDISIYGEYKAALTKIENALKNNQINIKKQDINLSEKVKNNSNDTNQVYSTNITNITNNININNNNSSGNKISRKSSKGSNNITSVNTIYSPKNLCLSKSNKPPNEKNIMNNTTNNIYSSVNNSKRNTSYCKTSRSPNINNQKAMYNIKNEISYLNKNNQKKNQLNNNIKDLLLGEFVMDNCQIKHRNTLDKCSYSSNKSDKKIKNNNTIYNSINVNYPYQRNGKYLTKNTACSGQKLSLNNSKINIFKTLIPKSNNGNNKNISNSIDINSNNKSSADKSSKSSKYIPLNTVGAFKTKEKLHLPLKKIKIFPLKNKLLMNSSKNIFNSNSVKNKMNFSIAQYICKTNKTINAEHSARNIKNKFNNANSVNGINHNSSNNNNNNNNNSNKFLSIPFNNTNKLIKQNNTNKNSFKNIYIGIKKRFDLHKNNSQKYICIHNSKNQESKKNS